MRLLSTISSGKRKGEYSLNHLHLTRAAVPAEPFMSEEKQDEAGNRN